MANIQGKPFLNRCGGVSVTGTKVERSRRENTRVDKAVLDDINKKHRNLIK